MTTATKLATCTLLIAAALAFCLLVTSRAHAQQGCTQVKMIFAEAWNTLYLVDGNGNRLRDIVSGNTLSNRQIDSYIVLRGIPSRIGIEIEDTGETLYRYESNVVEPGDRGYEDYIDDDFDDAVILLTSVGCPGAVTPRQVTPREPPPPPADRAVTALSVSSVSADNITKTTARVVVNITDHDGTELTVKLRYQENAEVQDWPNAHADTATSSTSPATRNLEDLMPGTEYVLQASLDAAFPSDGTKEDIFTTKQPASVSSVRVAGIGRTSATAMVKIADGGTEMKQVFLKYGIEGSDEWTQLPFPTITYTDGVSIDLTGLDENTTYIVMVDLTEGFDDPTTVVFSTQAAPSISEVAIRDIMQTSAVAAVKIADAGSLEKAVFFRYRQFGESEWGTAHRKTVTGVSAAYNMVSLTPSTTYEVQASLSSDFVSSKSAVFTTSAPAPSLSGVSVDDITQASAVATVKIANAATARMTVYMRHRASGAEGWATAQSKTTAGASAAFGLVGLNPKTTYEVEASFSSDFTVSVTATFTTLAPDPSLSGVVIGSITQTSAVATVTIADPGGEPKTVHLQYRVEGTSAWSIPALTESTEDGSVDILMTGLDADTRYEVQASLDSEFGESVSDTFATLRYPSLSGIDVTDITRTTATAEIDIANPDGTTQTIHLRYRTTPQGDWSSTRTTASTTADASIALTGLTEDTEYKVQASLASDFTITVSYTFITLPPDPVVSSVRVGSIRQTTATATIDIANTNGDEQTVHMRYRLTTSSGDWSEVLTTTSSSDSATVDLSGLTPGTGYDVQASLESAFPAARTGYDTFTTLRYPSISSIESENIGRNGATVSATVADSRGMSQTVYIRHRQARYVAWRPTQQTDSVDDVASLRLRGLSSGRDYIAEASLDSNFPSGETRSVTFTTRERRDDDDGSSRVVVQEAPAIVQEARAVKVPLLGFSPMTLRFVAIEGGDNPSPQTFSVWNRAQGAMDFILSNHQEWLSREPTSGMSGGPADKVDIMASVDLSGLASGQYVDIISIDVSPSGSSPGQVIVMLDVLPPDYVRQVVSRSEGGVVILPDGTVKIVVQPLSPPKDVDIELMKVNPQARGVPSGDRERVVVAIESNTYEPGGDTSDDAAYSPNVELWIMLPDSELAACADGKTKVYSVASGDWRLVEHRCETLESNSAWVVSEIERLGAFALVIDDSPAMPTPVAAAVSSGTQSTPVPVVTTTSMLRVPRGIAVQRTSLPARAPTPIPTQTPAPPPTPIGKMVVAPVFMPTPTPTTVAASTQRSVPVMQASTVEQSSGFNGLLQRRVASVRFRRIRCDPPSSF